VALRAHARINLAAVERNVVSLRGRLKAPARLCAVVKANASEHGSVPVARAALAAGASGLAVATAGEAAELREAGLSGSILLLGALSGDELPVALAARCELVAWSEAFVDAVAAAAGETVALHVKLDTGMGRLGTRRRAEALGVAERIMARGAPLRLAGAMTHFATADGDREFMAAQLTEFTPFAEQLRGRVPGLIAHAANSAATVRDQATHFDMVRCGIALYGCDPMNEDPDRVGLEPALELSSYVAAVKSAQPGDSVGYGRRFIAERETWIATVPIGYGDGVRRAFSGNLDVLIRGRRLPVVGTVSMDNITVDLGPGPPAGIEPGTKATIVGRDGAERQTVEDLANRIGTIDHEILCGLSGRVTRTYHRDGQPVA
jgi:alanine racemase